LAPDMTAASFPFKIPRFPGPRIPGRCWPMATTAMVRWATLPSLRPWRTVIM